MESRLKILDVMLTRYEAQAAYANKAIVEIAAWRERMKNYPTDQWDQSFDRDMDAFKAAVNELADRAYEALNAAVVAMFEEACE